MGFIGDLFKEKVNWSEQELMALFASMMSMSAVDGNIDEDETKVITLAIAGLPSNANFTAEQLINIGKNALKISPQRHVEVLRSMHKDKKNIALGALVTVGMADGDFDRDEQFMFEKFRQALQ